MATIVGKKFPDISVNAMDKVGATFKVNVYEEALNNNKKVLLFWYPKDFTFVCPTELHAFQAKLSEFERRNVAVIGASCDTPEVHSAWLNIPKNKGGIEGITYPILADSQRKLANILGILDTSQASCCKDESKKADVEGDNVTYRATYLIDEEGTVFHEGVNHMPLGRNVNDYLRLIDAYAHVRQHGEVCPANWEEGKEAMKPSAEGTATYLSDN